jgi:hypothetical protein
MTDTIADIRPGSSLKRSYEERQKRPDDLEAQEGQRPIAIHALENLAHSDSGIVMLRRLLREQLQRVERGLEPINTMRDPKANQRIRTGAWNTILSSAEAAALPYSDDLSREARGRGAACGRRIKTTHAAPSSSCPDLIRASTETGTLIPLSVGGRTNPAKTTRRGLQLWPQVSWTSAISRCGSPARHQRASRH